MTETEDASVRADIRAYLAGSPLAGHEFQDGDELLLSGLLDSLSVMRLVAFLEMEFGITIPPEDITVTNLASVDAMAAYLARERV
ncbi:acyl carrier protein (plasmid) [Pseudohalocynthiibacter aestuariivivens]|uniref:Phosphopantetheine-binding protein n=1 Tax=Roseovarius pelagicus TaxID=2980108 RepID=A0ABY6D5I7_9RHOB|nr:MULTISPECIES: phosphopantetheine-binding protein [Rhodobacterales]QIE47929.1 acyl carrier protein [Pseudohalocynthiibacter aestuariivivens]UXX81422.1 phosphopantetheine-binding protein [Roseovarius pelagicus]